VARPRTHDETVRRRLLEHASAAVAEGGPSSLSVRRVAAAAGTTTAAVYSLFGSRELLVNEVVAEGFRRFAERLAAVPRTDDPSADLLALGVAYRENALANPHFYRVMFSPVPGATVVDARSSVASPTFRVLADAAARAAAGAGPAVAEAVAVRLWAQAHGLVSLELAGLVPGTPEELAAGYLGALRGEPALTPPRPSG
jgi:AcrR family transcriptional regulator